MSNSRDKSLKRYKLKTFLGTLRNPMVITSIISQILIILTLFKINVDVDMISKIVIAVCSILVSLGIMNNPSKESTNKSIKIRCSKCGNISEYLMISGELMCDENGNPYEVSDEVIKSNKN